MSSVSQCKRAQHVGARSNSTAHVEGTVGLKIRDS